MEEKNTHEMTDNEHTHTIFIEKCDVLIARKKYTTHLIPAAYVWEVSVQKKMPDIECSVSMC